MILYHSPYSRSSTMITLLKELGAPAESQVEVKIVSIRRSDGTGQPDPSNPHPEGKVPYLVNGADHVRERGAITTYLCEAFPQAGFAPMPGDPKRGQFLSWMAYYQGVMEPVLVAQFCEIDHPAYYATFRGLPEICATIRAALEGQDYLLGDKYSAADLLIASPFLFFTDLVPDDPVVAGWIARCGARHAVKATAQADQAELAAMT